MRVQAEGCTKRAACGGLFAGDDFCISLFYMILYYIILFLITNVIKSVKRIPSFRREQSASRTHRWPGRRVNADRVYLVLKHVCVAGSTRLGSFPLQHVGTGSTTRVSSSLQHVCRSLPNTCVVPSPTRVSLIAFLTRVPLYHTCVVGSTTRMSLALYYTPCVYFWPCNITTRTL